MGNKSIDIRSKAQANDENEPVYSEYLNQTTPSTWSGTKCQIG